MLSCLFGSASSWAASQLHLQAIPLFVGDYSSVGIVPMEVTVQNNGADARGYVRINSEQLSLAYPIELPQGSNKKLTVYPMARFGTVTVTVDTDHGSETQLVPLGGLSSDEVYVLLIGDSSGELSFVKGSPQKVEDSAPGQSTRSLSIHDSYVRPEAAPGRASGYSAATTVILGQGAERLGDEAVSALKSWAAGGKSLVFLGGASSPILSDPRWQDILPAHGFRTVNLAKCEYLSNLGERECPPMTITQGNAVVSAQTRKQGDNLIAATMPYGLGAISYYSFNPFDAPLNRWEGRAQAFSKILRATQNLTAGHVIEGYQNSYFGGSPRYALGAPAGPAFGSPIPNEDPFDAKLPPTETVFSLLVLYFVLVVPVNFLVLRKFKKGELAWFTAPVISLVFAAILFQSASGLYRAKMSTVSTGLVVGQAGNPVGSFFGATQMFLPTAGSYDLKLKNVISIGSGDYYYDYYSRSDNQFEVVDTGELSVPSYSVDNLSFRQIEYRQNVPVGQWFDIHLTPTGPDTADCEIRNKGAVGLKNATLNYGVEEKVIGDLKPGDRKTFPVRFTQIVAKDLGYQDIKVFLQRKKRVALEGTITDFRPGPQIGSQIDAKTSVHLCLFANLESTR